MKRRRGAKFLHVYKRETLFCVLLSSSLSWVVSLSTVLTTTIASLLEFLAYFVKPSSLLLSLHLFCLFAYILLSFRVKSSYSFQSLVKERIYRETRSEGGSWLISSALHAFVSQRENSLISIRFHLMMMMIVVWQRMKEEVCKETEKNRSISCLSFSWEEPESLSPSHPILIGSLFLRCSFFVCCLFFSSSSWSDSSHALDHHFGLWFSSFCSGRNSWSHSKGRWRTRRREGIMQTSTPVLSRKMVFLFFSFDYIQASHFAVLEPLITEWNL